MWIHMISGSLILVLTMALGLLAFRKTEYEVKVELHSLFGFIVLLIVTLIVTLGFVVWNRMKD